MERPWKLSDKGYKNYKCEICGYWRIHDPQLTVCATCAAQLEREWKAKEKQRAKEWGEKHKCQNCGAALPLSRHIHCAFCASDPDNPREDGEALRRLDQAARAITEKRCSRCRKIFPITQFHVDRRRPDGRHIYCPKCSRKFANDWQKRSSAKLKALKEAKAA